MRDNRELGGPLDLASHAYVSHKLERRSGASGGFGLFVTAPIVRNEMLVTLGGVIVDQTGLERLPQRFRRRSIQIEDDLYQVSVRDDEDADCINHSCNPNAGISGQIVLVAMRDIGVGEEITYDYAMSDSTPYDMFDCDCGMLECRGKVTSEDWRNPTLWTRYDGYFSLYLARRITQLRAQNAAQNRLKAD